MRVQKDRGQHYGKKGQKCNTDRICKQIFIGRRKKIRDKRAGIISSSVGPGELSFIFLRKTN